MLLLLPWKLRYLIASKVKGEDTKARSEIADILACTYSNLLPQL